MDTQETPAPPAPALPIKTLYEVEKEHIIAVLAVAPTLDEAARILDIDIATLYRKRVRMKLPIFPQHSGERLTAAPIASPSPYEPFKAARELLAK